MASPLQVRILSAVINFAKFRLDKMDQIDQYEEMLVREPDPKPTQQPPTIAVP